MSFQVKDMTPEEVKEFDARRALKHGEFLDGRRTAQDFEPDRRKLATRRHYEDQATIAELASALRNFVNDLQFAAGHDQCTSENCSIALARVVLAKLEGK